MKIILGSESQGRKKLLEKWGYHFEVMPANIDEKAIRSRNPIKLTMKLAHAKADALIPKIKESALLITCDQVVVCNSVIREKPENEKEARAFLESYSRFPAEVVVSVVVTNIVRNVRESGTDIATIWFHPLPNDVIDSYIASGDPFLHAGAFDHEHPILFPHVKRVKGEEASIVGLPKRLIEELLRKSYNP